MNTYRVWSPSQGQSVIDSMYVKSMETWAAVDMWVREFLFHSNYNGKGLSTVISVYCEDVSEVQNFLVCGDIRAHTIVPIKMRGK